MTDKILRRYVPSVPEGTFIGRKPGDGAGHLQAISGAEAIAFLSAYVDRAWPVGAVFISVVATDPNVLLGYGTWAALAAGRVLVGIDVGDADFDTVEETGGAKTHTLTSAEMPSHTHNVGSAANTTGLGGADVFAGNAAVPSGATGGGGAHNNVQPYLVVYMWKRTA